MADEKPEDTQGENPQGEEGSEEEIGKIKLGDEEYEPAELQGMIELSGKVREFEKKSGTDFAGLTSSWGKRGEEIGKLKKELEEFKTQKTEEKVKAGEQLSEEEQIRQAQEQARRLKLVTDDYLDKWFEEKISAREAGRDLLNDCRKLEKKIDGKDGRPAFKTQDVLDYMGESGVKNPQDAYDLKYKSELLKWRDEKLLGRKPAGLTTETTSTAGGKEPPKIKLTPDNLDKAVRDELYRGGA